ncbi:MAG TPA: hypothetical protein VFJ08_13655 [Salinisphaera sp.]|nr:hypothetical protein [Salinisphaera sp.]
MIAGAGPAGATVIKAGIDVFKNSAPSIGFDGLPLNVANPTFQPAPGLPGGTSVMFGGYFVGQSRGTVASCGALGCLDGQPSGTLTLDAGAEPTFVTLDTSAPDDHVLSGSPRFTGPISILFGTDQAAVGVMAGFATDSGAERLTAFGRDGSILASIVNDALGYSFLALASDDGSAAIAGVQITRTGATPGGFAVSDLRFGGPDQIEISGGGSGNGEPSTPVPAPGNLALFALALGLITIACRRRARGQRG